MPEFKAFISDLDDTLLGANHQMSARTEQTLRRLLAQGVKVILASGRAAASMWPTVQQIQTPWPYIAFNGAQIVDAKDGRVLMFDGIALGLARDVLEWLENQNVHMHYYDGPDWYCDTYNDIAKSYEQGTGIAGKAVGPLHQHIQCDTPKLLGIDTPERVQTLIEAGRKRYGDRLSITTSKAHFIEITSPTATKGNAVRKLAEMIGLAPGTTICAGDSLNDLSMLEWSDWPVTVSNGRDSIKEIAWRVAGHAHEDGIAILLDEIIPER